METKDWITIVSVISIVLGWFVNSWLNRRHEIAKKRLELRLDALLSFIPVLFAIQENQTNNDKFQEDITSCRTKFQLFCYSNEIQEFEKIVYAIENKNETEYNNAVRSVAKIVRNHVRKELNLDIFNPVQQ